MISYVTRSTIPLVTKKFSVSFHFRARIEHDNALKRVITAMFKDDARLFKQFQDNDSFPRWLTDTMFGMTYED